MSLATIAFNQIVTMFLILLVGVLCFKVKFISQEMNRGLSNILLMLITPVLIIHSYQQDFSSELLEGLLISFALAIITHIFAIIISMIFKKNKNMENGSIERFSSIYSNCGFMGLPLVNGIFGAEGVLYVTAYMTIFNIFIWTHGLMLMIGKQDKKQLVKVLLSPTLVSIIVGILMFITQFKLPSVIGGSIKYLADMNTPLAMLIAGVTIAQTDIKAVFKKKGIYLVSFLKLIFVPIVLLVVFQFIPSNPIVITTAILAASCPTATTGTLFALRYNKNALYASEIFAFTTILSLFTIPIVMALSELLLR